MNALTKYQPLAEKAAAVMDWVMTQELKLYPPEVYELGSSGERVALVARFNALEMGRATAYEDAATIRRLRLALDGLPLVKVEDRGLTYVIPLNGKPKLPKRVDLPAETRRGLVSLGARHNGKVIAKPWNQYGHICIVGKTGSGKSGALRLFAWQALRDGFLLAIADNDRSTFPMLANHSAMFAPIAADPEAAFELIERLAAECDSRAAMFQSIHGHFPDTMEEYNDLAEKSGKELLKPILVILDELSNTIIRSGSKQKRLLDLLGALGMRGRKFGIRVIFAAHEFTKEQLGMIRPQCETFIAFRNDAVEMSRLIGCAGAERIPQDHAGMAVTNKWGRIQTFFLDKSRLGSEPGVPSAMAKPSPLPEREALLVKRAIEENRGKMTLGSLMQWGLSEWDARSLIEEYERRGWVEKNPRQGNARVVTPKLADLLSNLQTAQSASNPQIQPQTVLKPPQTLNMGGVAA